MGYLPIEDHGIIGDLHTAALVGTDGTIDWLCLPRFDSPSVFASILDDEKGGHFRIRPLNDVHSHQLYLSDTNVLLTRFLSPEGVAEVVDFMPVEERGEVRHDLVRDVRVVRGRMTIEVDCRPAFDYARQEHTIEFVKGGVIFRGAGIALNLASEVPLEEGPTRSLFARFDLKEGESASFVLQQLKEGEGPREAPKKAECQDMLQRTLDYWRRWVSRSTYRGRWREMVNRSALALKLMIYEPTGALVAAPTMGLRETSGNERNFDHRYTWVRDAAFALYALISVGHDEEARRFISWLEYRCRHSRGCLQALYDIDGRTEINVEELTHLSGYHDSGPVRLGSEVNKELHLDVYGPMLDAVYLHNKYGAPLDYDVWKNLRPILDWLGDNWRQPDEGMWEVSGRREHVSSKVMSWVALERAVRIAFQRGLPAGQGRWVKERDAIYEDVWDKGWDTERKSFVQFYGSKGVDASLLLMPLVKFVGPTDPRWLATLERIERELTHDALVCRYEGEEGNYSVSCSFWLVECLVWAGRLEQARMHMEKLLSYANHLGLYGGEIGATGEALGSFPKAFSHLALISAAVHLDRALG